MRILIPIVHKPKVIELANLIYSDPGIWKIEQPKPSRALPKLPPNPRVDFLKELIAKSSRSKPEKEQLLKALNQRAPLTLTITQAPHLVSNDKTRTLTWTLHKEGEPQAENIIFIEDLQDHGAELQCLGLSEESRKPVVEFTNKVVKALLPNLQTGIEILSAF